LFNYQIFKYILETPRPSEWLCLPDSEKHFPEVWALRNVIPDRKRYKVDLWEHSVLCVDMVRELGGDYLTACAAFFHDVGKIKSMKGHEDEGAALTNFRLSYLEAPIADIHRVVRLVRNHNSKNFNIKADKKLIEFYELVGGKEQFARFMILAKGNVKAGKLLCNLHVKEIDEFCSTVEEAVSRGVFGKRTDLDLDKAGETC